MLQETMGALVGHKDGAFSPDGLRMFEEDTFIIHDDSVEQLWCAVDPSGGGADSDLAVCSGCYDVASKTYLVRAHAAAAAAAAAAALARQIL